jgi:membrane protease YdiL (CAAX protease family)
MYDSNSKGISYTAGFFILIAFTVAGAVFAASISGLIWTKITGKSLEVFADGLAGPEDAVVMRWIQVITALVGFLLPAILTAYMLNRRPVRLLGFNNHISPGQIVIVLIILIASIIISSMGLSYINEVLPVPDHWRVKFDKWEADYSRQVDAIVVLKDQKDFIVAIIVMAFLPALCEETLFRGGLQNFLTRSTGKPWLSILIVSLIFSVMHIEYYGFLSRFFLGAVLGLIYYLSGNLWLSIGAHFLNNALSLTQLYLYKKEGKTMTDAISETNNNWWGLLVIPLLVLLFIYFKRISASSRLKAEV